MVVVVVVVVVVEVDVEAVMVVVVVVSVTPGRTVVDPEVICRRGVTVFSRRRCRAG